MPVPENLRDLVKRHLVQHLLTLSDDVDAARVDGETEHLVVPGRTVQLGDVEVSREGERPPKTNKHSPNRLTKGEGWIFGNINVGLCNYGLDICEHIYSMLLPKLYFLAKWQNAV